MREISIRPNWKLLTSLHARPADATPSERTIHLHSSKAWGTGEHETTQLCVHAVTHFGPKGGTPFRVLDFGSGSGILSIVAAKLGGQVQAVEIDPGAHESARLNARLNGVEVAVTYLDELPVVSEPFAIVVANILKPVLLAFATELSARVARPGGTLILSGLLAADMPAITVRYAPFFGGQAPEIFTKGEWRAVVWRT